MLAAPLPGGATPRPALSVVEGTRWLSMIFMLGGVRRT